MTVTIGRFAKSFRTGASTYDEDCLTSIGNEQRILGTLRAAVAGQDITAAAATQESFVVARGLRLKQTRMALRPTVAVVDAGSIVPVIKTSWSVQGTATSNLTDSNAIASIGSTNLGTDTTSTADWVFNSDVITPGSRIVIRHVAGTGGSVAGTIDTVVYAREVKPDTN